MTSEQVLFTNPEYFHPDTVPDPPVRVDDLLSDLRHLISYVIQGSRSFVVIQGGPGRGKTTTLSAIHDALQNFRQANDDVSTTVFRHSCDQGQKPKSVFQALLSELGEDMYVKNRNLHDVWCRIEDQLRNRQAESVFFLPPLL